MSFHDEPPQDPPYSNLPVQTDTSHQSRPPKPNADTLRIIRSLDMRFPPNFATSERDREAQVLLLASDLRDIHPRLLQAAADEWVRTKAFMPKASELRNLCATIKERGKGEDERAEIGNRVAANYNARLANEPKDKGIRWIYDAKADSLKLVPLDEYRRMSA